MTRGKRGVSALELLLGFGVVVLVVGLFIYQTGLLHLTLIRVSKNGLVRSLDSIKKEATGGRVLVTFRPRGGPYQSYITERGDEQYLQRGVYLVNTNGSIHDDGLYLDLEGKLYQDADDGAPVSAHFTVASTQTEGIAEIYVDRDGRITER